MILSTQQKKILYAIDQNATLNDWTDWRWQMRHNIRDLTTFEKLLDIKLPGKQRQAFDLTVKKFPLSITPYYLSLINMSDMANDPIFIQSVPSP